LIYLQSDFKKAHTSQRRSRGDLKSILINDDSCSGWFPFPNDVSSEGAFLQGRQAPVLLFNDSVLFSKESDK
jgi:hypothetical protein